MFFPSIWHLLFFDIIFDQICIPICDTLLTFTTQACSFYTDLILYLHGLATERTPGNPVRVPRQQTPDAVLVEDVVLAALELHYWTAWLEVVQADWACLALIEQKRMVRKYFDRAYKVKVCSLSLADIVWIVKSLHIFQEVCLLLRRHTMNEVAHKAESEQTEQANEDGDVRNQERHWIHKVYLLCNVFSFHAEFFVIGLTKLDHWSRVVFQ